MYCKGGLFDFVEEDAQRRLKDIETFVAERTRKREIRIERRLKEDGERWLNKNDGV